MQGVSTANNAPGVQYFDLETKHHADDKAHADRLYEAGHRIRVSQGGVDISEWIPGSHDYYVFRYNRRIRVRHLEIQKGGASDV